MSLNLSKIDTTTHKYLNRYKDIYYIGNLDLLYSTCFTVIGSRKMTGYGKQVVGDLCKSFVEYGITTVSGYVDGVDLEVFSQTLKNGGNTIVCLGYGFDQFINDVGLLNIEASLESRKRKQDMSNFHSQPSSPASIFYFLASNNLLVLSQFPNNQAASRWTFPKRDELLASVGAGVVVVEAAEKSGTFYTVKQAFKEDKKVYAVPNSIYSPQSVGCYHLINKGFWGKKADVYYSFDQIKKYLRLSNSTSSSGGDTDYAKLSEEEKAILSALSSIPQHFDDIISTAKISSQSAGITLTKLELSGHIKNIGGGMYIRVG